MSSEVDKQDQDTKETPHILKGEDCPTLASLTTIELGGKPQYYAKVTDELKAIDLAQWTKKENLALWVIGGGSNIVCDDKGLSGLVLQVAIPNIEWGKLDGNKYCLVTVGSGINWHQFVEESVKRELAGVECLIGIPGWMGAAPIQNIGAYGQSFSDVCVGVKVYDIKENKLGWWTAKDCNFAYRDSIFKRNPSRYLIMAVKLKLTYQGKPTLKYRQLIDRMQESGHELSLSTVSSLVKTLRAEKSMLWQKEDPNHRSVGSFFMNPCLSKEQIERLLLRCQELNKEGLPQWPSDSSTVKTSAAWLIEQSGFTKGECDGRVGLSTKHCLALINRGGGHFNELMNLAKKIQRRVWSTFKVWLEPEANIFSTQELPLLRFQPRIALATCQNLPDWEVDDHPLWQALEEMDVELCHPSWDNKEFTWAECDLVIPRTTWDYQGRWPEFLAWLNHIATVTHLENPFDLMRWNLNKSYLKELNIPQPPIYWFEQRVNQNWEEQQTELNKAASEIKDICQREGWKKAFLKPSIGASAIGTLRFDLDDKEFEPKLMSYLQEWLVQRTLILQPYVGEVETMGECSLIYFAGQFSHAVRKVPVSGDYRVQDDYGATDMPWDPPEIWQSLCSAMLEELPHQPLYARCDFLHGPQRQPWLIELELIEPSLFFRHDPESPQRFARALVERCEKHYLPFLSKTD